MPSLKTAINRGMTKGEKQKSKPACVEELTDFTSGHRTTAINSITTKGNKQKAIPVCVEQLTDSARGHWAGGHGGGRVGALWEGLRHQDSGASSHELVGVRGMSHAGGHRALREDRDRHEVDVGLALGHCAAAVGGVRLQVAAQRQVLVSGAPARATRTRSLYQVYS